MFIILLLCAVNGQKIPYTFIDFDYINENNIWQNRNAVRTQTATDGSIIISSDYPTSTINDINNSSIGVFHCDNQRNGNADNTPNTAAYLSALTFDEFTLEVIVKPTVNHVIFYGYIIGIEGTGDNIEGNAIAYNEIYNKPSEESNKFFATNYLKDGWTATSQYWNSTTNTQYIDITKFYHVIVTQNSDGLVTVNVNGAQYGSSYMAPGGAKANIETSPGTYIKICGDAENVGFDGYVRAFGFYTESFTSIDAVNACNQLNGMHMIECAITTAGPTTTTKPDTTSVIIINTITNTSDSSHSTSSITKIDTSSITKSTGSNWVNKDGKNCPSGYTDVDSLSVYYDKYCGPCPDDTAGTHGNCEGCGTLEVPNHSRTSCDYWQPFWLYLIEIVGSLSIFVSGVICIFKYCNSHQCVSNESKDQTVSNKSNV